MHDIKFSYISHILLVMNKSFVFKRKLVSLNRLPLESIEQKHTFYGSSHDTSSSSISISKLIHSLSLLLSNFNVSPEKINFYYESIYTYMYPFILVSESQLSPRYLSHTSVSFPLFFSLSLFLYVYIYVNLNTQSSD